MGTSNAERQRQYRDRQRGGPPKGRWHGHTKAADIARSQHVSRASLFMAEWILKHAPDVVPDCDAGKVKITPTYRRLRQEYIMALARAMEKYGNRPLVCVRKNGRFVFKLAKKGTKQ